MHGLNFVSIPTGRMEWRSAVVDACLLQCQGELIVVVMNPLTVCSCYQERRSWPPDVDRGLFVLPGVGVSIDNIVPTRDWKLFQ